MKKFLLIMPHLKKYRKDFCIYFLFAFIAWIISFILPYISGSYIDALLTAKKQYVYWFTFIVCTLTVINIFFKYMSEIAVGKVNTNIGFQISFTLYEKLKRVSLSYFHSIDTVYLVNRINSDSNDIIGFFYIKYIVSYYRNSHNGIKYCSFILHKSMHCNCSSYDDADLCCIV